MANNSIYKIKELLGGASQITLALEANPGLDDMAASLSLSLSLDKAGKKTVVICETPPTVALSNLVGIDKVSNKQAGTGAGGGNGLIISLPYEQGSIEKISYDIVGDRINLTVVPGQKGLTFTTDDIVYKTPTQGGDLVVAIGIGLESKIPFDAKAGVLVNIDNDAQNEGYGTIALIDGTYSSNCEIITKLLQELALPIDIDSAQNLLSGIIDATGNFQSQNTSSYAFEAAAFLMQKGAMRVKDKAVRDSFIAQEEAKVLEQRNFPREEFPWEAKAARPKPTLPKAPINEQPQPGAPKDWFGPKIYRGSKPPLS